MPKIKAEMYDLPDGTILTHGFIKKQNKTPPNEIDRAIRYRKEYFNRKGEKK